MMSEVIYEIKHIKKSYGTTMVLKDINLCIKKEK